MTKSTLLWVDKFLINSNWKNYRFKCLEIGYPPFDFPEHLIDKVNIEQFLLEERARIPLLIGSQFGVFPNPEEIFKDLKRSILIAKLGKSILSGAVAGLSISIYKNGVFKEIEFFSNKKLL